MGDFLTGFISQISVYATLLQHDRQFVRLDTMPRKKPRKKAKRGYSIVEIAGLTAIGIFVIGVVWLAFFTPPPQAPTQTTTYTPAPDFTLTDVDGNTFRLSSQTGKVVVLEFMRTTCEACVRAGPYMTKLRSSFGDDVVMVMISIDPAVDTSNGLRSYRDADMPGWIAARDTPDLQISTQYSVQGTTPTFVIIDKDGYIRHQQAGFAPTGSQLATFISDIDSLRR
jgi:cytochrome oxidase Cu insertion factor (SCO1/SenC/PrrC family)